MRLLKGSWIILLLAAAACSNNNSDDKLGNWHKDGSVGSLAAGRVNAVGFVVNDTAYYGTGTDGTTGRQEFWAYESHFHTWNQISNFAGAGRWGAAAFAANGKGYVGTGYDGYKYYKDFYQYTPTANAWELVTNEFPGTARRYSTGFGIGTVGYLTSGQDSTPSPTKDFYTLDATTNTWKKQLGEYNGDPRFGATAFVLNNKAYFVSGQSNLVNVADWYVFSPDSLAAGVNGWHKLRDIANNSTDSYDDKYSSIIRVFGTSFVIGTKGYLTTGQNGGLTNTTWEYDATNDTWTQKTDFEGNARITAFGFSLAGKGYVAGGGSSSSSAFTDMYYFSPSETMVAND